MSIKQKLGIGLFISVVSVTGYLFFGSSNALAATEGDFTSGASYTVTAFDTTCNKPKTVSTTIAGHAYTFTDSNPCDNILNLKPNDLRPRTVICDASDSNGKKGGITYSGTSQVAPDGRGFYSATILVEYFSGNSSTDSCSTQPTKIKTLDASISGLVFDTSLPGAPAPQAPGGSGVGASTGTSDTAAGATAAPTCESSSSTALEWIMCPIFNIVSDLTNHLVGLFEGQLCFKTDAATTGSTAKCSALDTTDIKPAWSAIKNIVSALLVIIMLLAIISQAFSIGPLDAYTIRKLLPKLVAAVILIQVSFWLFSFVIGVVNDVGEGLSSLLNALFPADINSLSALLANADPKIGAATTTFWLSVLGVIAFAVAALPTLLLLLFVAVVAIIVGLAVLVFRKVLIVTLLLLAPVALLMWVLPNTEKYWKMWLDNFLKILFMFPIIILIIEAGRIFAWVAGKTSGGGFIGVFLVIVGFFGPLFILPKTFRWGGALMQATGNGIFKASGKMTEKPEGYFKARQEGLSAERRRQSQERFAKGEKFNISRPWRRPIDLMRSGRADPLLWGRRSEQAATGYAAKGAESMEADLKAAEQRQSLMYEEAANHDKLARDMAAGYDTADSHLPADQRRAITYKTKSGELRNVGKVSMTERQAALGAVARYGGGGNMRFIDRMNDQLDNGTNEERVMAERFRNANAQTLLPKMKHVYFGGAGVNRDVAIERLVENGVTESSFTGMDTAEMEAILASLSQRAAQGGDDGNRAAGQLSAVLTSYEAAASNPNIRPSIDAGVNKAVEAFVDGANIESVNYKEVKRTNPETGQIEIETSGRRTLGLPEIDRGAADSPMVSEQVAKLRGRIDAAGNIRDASATAPTSGTRAAGTQPPAGGGRFNPPGGSSTPSFRAP